MAFAAPLKAMACGMIPVTINADAVPETLAGAGVLVSLDGAEHAGEPQTAKKLAGPALRVLISPQHAAELRKGTLHWAGGPSWEGVRDDVPLISIQC
jgi:hypothetical protein